MTTPLGFRYPALTDQNVPPVHIQNLATDVNNYLTALGPRFQYHQGTVQNTSNGNQLIVNNMVKDIDTVGGYNTSTGVWTCPAGMGGQWEFSALGNYTQSGTNVTFFNLSIWVGGTSGTPKVHVRGYTNGTGVSGITTLVIPDIEIAVADGDQVSLQVYAQGGGGQSLTSSFMTLWRGKKVG